MKNLLKNPFFYLSVFLVFVLSFQVVKIIRGYTQPSGSPPELGNVFKPLNEGPEPQAKTGGLTVGDLTVSGTNVGIELRLLNDQTVPLINLKSGDQIGQIRLWDGKLQFKNHNSSWLDFGTGGGSGISIPLILETGSGGVGIVLKNSGGGSNAPFITWRPISTRDVSFSIRADEKGLYFGKGDNFGFYPFLALTEYKSSDITYYHYRYNRTIVSGYQNPPDPRLPCDNDEFSQNCPKDSTIISEFDLGTTAFDAYCGGEVIQDPINPDQQICNGGYNALEFSRVSTSTSQATYKIRGSGEGVDNAPFIVGSVRGLVGKNGGIIGDLPQGTNSSRCITFLQSFRDEDCSTVCNTTGWAACLLEGNQIKARYFGDLIGPTDGYVSCGYLCW